MVRDFPFVYHFTPLFVICAITFPLSVFQMSCSLQPQYLCSSCLSLVKTDCLWGHNCKSFLSESLPWSSLLWDSCTTLYVLIMIFLTLNCRLFAHLDPPPFPDIENCIRWGAMSVLIIVLLLAHVGIIHICQKQVSPSYGKSNKYVNLAGCWLFSKYLKSERPN